MRFICTACWICLLWLIPFFLSCPILLHAEEQNANIYVATNGNDAWLGTLPVPNSTRTNGPKATFNGARLAVQKISRNRNSPIVVMFRGGEYYLPSTVNFTSADSGTPTVPVVYQAYPGENVVISGGRKITGWKPLTGNAWMAPVSLPQPFSQLWINGERRLRSRSSTGYLHFGTNNTSNSFEYQGSDLNPDWSNIGDIEVDVFEFWTSSRVRLKSIIAATHTATVTGYFPPVWYKGFVAGHNYFLENVADAFGRPGEWYYNSVSKTLKYTLEKDDPTDPNQAQIIVPQLYQLMTGAGVRYLKFTNLNFANANWTLPANGYVAGQADTGLQGAIRFVDSNHISFEGDSIRHVGAYGIEFQSSNNFSFTDGEVSDTGGGGIKVGDPDCGTDASVPSYATITDNLLYAAGRLFAGSPPIYFGNSHHNLISHNEIFNTYNVGISVGMFWGYGCYTTHDNEISYNLIHDYGQGVTSDMAGIYILGSQGGNNSIDHNEIYDAVYNNGTADGYGGWGIYTDRGTTATTIEDNLVYNTTSPSYHLNMMPGQAPETAVTPNIIRNNIFARATGMFDKNNDEKGPPYRIAEIENNVYYEDYGPLGVVQSSYPKTHTDFDCQGVSCASIVLFEKNMYYDTRTANFTFQSTEPQKFYTFSQWQALGEDQGSAITNPLFADPGSGDFSFISSAAYQVIGFTPFDLGSVGPRSTAFQPTPQPSLYPVRVVTQY